MTATIALRLLGLGIMALPLPTASLLAFSSSRVPPLGITSTCDILLRMSGPDSHDDDHGFDHSRPRVVSVAILGGGISGLSCASHLLETHQQLRRQSQHAKNDSPRLEVTLFDTGRLRPGGRCSSRLPGDKDKEIPSHVARGGPRPRRCDDAVDKPPPAKRHDEGEREIVVPANLRKAIEASLSPGGDGAATSSFGPVDHAAQILSVPPDDGDDDGQTEFALFRSQIDRWVAEGVATPFPAGSVCELTATATATATGESKSTLRPLTETPMWYGVGGMASIPLALRDRCRSFRGECESFAIRQDVWVSPSNGVRYIGSRDKGENESENNNDDNNNNNKTNNSNRDDPKWELFAKGKSMGKFHKLVIAHNGKCADRIMSQTPAKELHSLLRTRFAPSVPKWGGKEMTLNSIYSLVFVTQSACLDEALAKLTNDRPGDDQKEGSDRDRSPSLPYTVMIQNEPNLRLLSCNTRKHDHDQSNNNDTNNKTQVWTLLSSPHFGKQFKGPQENLPPSLVETVTAEMLTGLERALDLPNGRVLRAVKHLRLQLWGAAVPMNAWRTATTTRRDGRVDGFVYDAVHGVGACGDWILDPSVAGAWESGRRLADWIVQGEENVSVGLPGSVASSGDGGGGFRPSRAASVSGIGTVPSLGAVGGVADPRYGRHREDGNVNGRKGNGHSHYGKKYKQKSHDRRSSQQRGSRADEIDERGSGSNGGGRVWSATA